MNIRINLLLALCVILSLPVLAQETEHKIDFDKEVHDFGTVAQHDPTQTVFTFTNTSEKDVKLGNVKASCGCTTPSYTTEAVKPGETGEINVKYNSARVGAFNKSVTVYYDGSDKPVVLRIKGTVEAAQQKVNYAHTLGGIALDKVAHSVADLQRDKSYTQEFQMKNISPIKIAFTDKMEKPEVMDVQITPTELNPGQTGKVILTINGEKFTKGGDFSESITLYTDEEEDAAKTFTFSGKAAYAANELDMQPNIEFAQTKYEGGTAIEGEKITYTYAFTNTGKADLEIQDVKASCGCTASTPKDKVVKPGASSEIVATFNSKGRVGTQRKTITVRTNDPDQPVVQLSLSVQVEKDPFAAAPTGPANNKSK